MLTIVDTQSLIFCAQEDRADDIADDENTKEDVVRAWMVVGVKDAEKDQTECAEDGKDQAEHTEDLLCPRGVLCKTTCVTKPSLGEETNVEEDGRHYAAGDE